LPQRRRFAGSTFRRASRFAEQAETLHPLGEELRPGVAALALLVHPETVAAVGKDCSSTGTFAFFQRSMSAVAVEVMRSLSRLMVQRTFTAKARRTQRKR